jgi:hypothetical protein
VSDIKPIEAHLQGKHRCYCENYEEDDPRNQHSLKQLDTYVCLFLVKTHLVPLSLDKP